MDEQVKKALDLRLASGEITIEEYRATLTAIQNGVTKVSGSEPATNGRSVEQEEARLVLTVNKDLSLFGSFLVYKGARHSYSTITSLTYSRSVSRTNLIPTSNRSYLCIGLENDQAISYSTETVLRRGELSKLFEKAYAFLQPITFQSRLNRIAYKLAQKRSIILPSLEDVTLFPNGDVETKKGTRLNLKDSKTNNGLIIGTYCSGWVSPDEIVIRERKSRWAKTISFTIFGDQDVWKALISWLAEPGNVL